MPAPDLLTEAYDSTARYDDERLLMRAVCSFSIRAEVRELLMELPGKDFHNPIAGRIWDAARELAEESRIITPDNLKVKLSDSEFRLLNAEYGQGVRLVEAKRGAEYVRQAAKRRRLVDALKAVAERVALTETYDDVLGFAHSELDALDAAESAGAAIPIDEAIDGFWEEFENPTPGKEKIPSPWDGLNDYLNGGGPRGAMIVFGALPGDGKSIAMLNWAGRAAMEGYRVAVFSLEMGVEDVTHRLIAAEAGEKISAIANGSLTPSAVDVLREFTDVLRDTTLRIYDSAGVDVNFIRQQCELMKREVGLDIVIVDYLQILDTSSTGERNREQQVGEAAKQLKTMGMKLDALVLTASQLNDNEAGQVPSLRSLRESKAIGQHADNVIMLVHELDAENVKTGEMRFHLVKNRRGRTGSVPQEFENHKVRIVEPRRLAM
ncbi:DNA helicase [Gordonia phage DatBoi]|nr:DNA helicase [Gordonia phage DatBoi]